MFYTTENYKVEFQFLSFIMKPTYQSTDQQLMSSIYSDF